MNLIDDLKWRYATKMFDPKRKISAEQLEILKDAINLTATSYGLQMYKVLIVETQEIKDKLREVSWNQSQVSDCSHHFIFLKHKKYEASFVEEFTKQKAEAIGMNEEKVKFFTDLVHGSVGKFSEEAFQIWSAKQTYIALGNLMAACANQRVDACPMEGIDAAAYDKILDLEDTNYSTVVACPVGFRSPEDKYQHMPKFRLDKKEVFETR